MRPSKNSPKIDNILVNLLTDKQTNKTRDDMLFVGGNSLTMYRERQ